jgi:hypothetical protein
MPLLTIGLEVSCGAGNLSKLSVFKGNITACEIRCVIGNIWDEYSDEAQSQLFEDLFTIKKKSSLKARLI